jgi:hypothetical protein
MSSDDQSGSIAKQTALIQQYADSHGLKITRSYVDKIPLNPR